MARREGWHQRRKRGVQGKAVEYSIDSLPDEVQAILHACDNSASYQAKRQDAFLIWVEAYYQLTREEREKIVTFILREGLAKLIQHLDAQELRAAGAGRKTGIKTGSVKIPFSHAMIRLSGGLRYGPGRPVHLCTVSPAVRTGLR